MDIHIGEKVIDLEVVRELHLMDKVIEHKYGVKHIHYYFNAEEGMGFCLLSGPDKETCVRVHKESHGDVASNIIEIEESTYENVMGIARVDNHDMVQTSNGLPDAGNRFVLFIELVGFCSPADEPRETILEVLRRNGGRLVRSSNHDIVALFNDCNSAIYGAGGIAGLADAYQKVGLALKIGLARGTPVTPHGSGLFDEAIELATRLARAAPEGKVLVSSKTAGLYKGYNRARFDKLSVQLINKNQEDFINQFFHYCNLQIESGFISVDKLCAEMGISRSQMYRKIRALSGISPREFIQELRLSRATQMINSGERNISQIAYHLGYSQPATFSKHFKQRFGTSPSKVRKVLSEA